MKIIKRYKIKFFLIIALLTTISSFSKAEEYAPGEILVKFKAETKKQEAKSANNLRWKLDAKEIQKFVINNVRHMELPAGISVEQAILEAYKDHNVQYAEPNYIVHANKIPNDPMYNQLWGMEKIQVPQAWDNTTGSNQIIIAVIDSGVDYNHPDIASQYVGGYDFHNNDSDPMDDNDHGTHVAGTIGAVGNNNIGVVGVCWNIKIMALKFLDSQGSGYLSNALSAIEYATNHGAKILSNSWGGGGYSQAMKDAITACGNAGCLFVAAAGNEGVNNDTNPHYPSSYDNANIIAVAATDQNDNLASFSCYGPNSVDLAAPGVSILSTVPGNQYKSYQGTSMSTPHVSGVCALIWAQNPTWTNIQVKDKLLQSVDQVSSLQGKVLTSGRLNAYKATQGGGTPPPEPPQPPPTPTPPGGNVIFYDDMEKGTNGWTTIGFDCLWHQTHKRYTSSNTAWYYGIEATMNYDTGWINFGSLISPTISLKNISATQCDLTFNYWREVEYYEDMYDVTTVMISPDGGWTWNILWWMDSSNPSTSKWEQETISLNDYIGEDIIIAFIFNTIDYNDNDYEGWYIDDVTITTDGGSEPPPAKQPNIEIEPTSIPDVQIPKDGTTSQTIKIKNTGEADLTYSISNKNTTSAEIYPYEPEVAAGFSLREEETINIDNTQWQVIWNKKTGTAHRVYGGSMTLSGLNERDFIAQHYDLLKVNEKDLKLERDEIHGNQRYITFQQMYNNIPVYNAKVELRYSTITNQLILFGSDAYPDINISTTPNITAEEAQKATKETGEIRSTELIIFPLTPPSPQGGEDVRSTGDGGYFLAYEVIIFTENPPHLWIYIINAADGSIITKWDAIKYGEIPSSPQWGEDVRSTGEGAEITGTVKGKVHTFYPTDGQILEELANEKINISGANSSYTDKNGYYKTTVSDTNSHSVTTNLSGSYVSITNKNGSNASYSGSAKADTPHNITWDDSNSNITERDVYYHIQLAHSKIKEIDPNFNGVDYCAPADVNYPNLSNAYFEGYGYCFGDGKDPQCPFNQNLGQVADVIFHEYGHGIMHFQYNQDWDNSLEFTSMHEGMADYFASTITNEPLIGEGINGTNYVMRNIDVPDATPSNTEPECHDRGKVIAGALWDLRKALGVELTDHLFHFARYGHAKTFTDYYIDLLLEDDNDGNYNNGTPHSQEIYSTFALHDIANVNPKDPNDATTPAKTSDLTAVTPTYNTISLQWTAPGDDGTIGTAHSYDIRYSTSSITDANWSQANQLQGEPYPKKAGSAETVTVSGLESDTTYYFVLKTRDNNGNWSALSNIANAVTKTATTIYSNDMETDTTGWTTDCTWAVIGTGGHSGARCWTDTPNGNYSNNTNCSLISPSFDLTNSATTTLNLWHKYNLEKDYDFGYVEISTNNGAAWEIIKTYTGQNTNWTNTTVDLIAYDGQKDIKIRFRLHSNYTGTNDGWYIDDVKILASGNAATPKWLTFNPTSGTIPANSEQTITLNYDAKALKVGDYETNVTITSNDPDTPQLQLTAKMKVTDTANTPPNAPTGLKATAGNKQVELSWNANTETDLAGYNIYRKETAGAARITGKTVCDITTKLNESLNLIKVFPLTLTLSPLGRGIGEGDLTSLIELGIAVYENMGTYAIAEVTNEELDKLSNYKILDIDSQTKQYYVIWGPTLEPGVPRLVGATILDIDNNTAIIHTDPETALQLPQLGFQIRPIRRTPLLLGEETIASYEFSLTDTPKQTLIKEMVSKVQESSTKNYLQTLQNFGTRYSYANGYDQSASWAFNQFKQMGLEVSYHQFSINVYNTNSVVATLKGTTKPDQIFIICGHMDSISENPEASAPGAEDNGSGSVVVMEAARILSQYKFDSTISFILFGGEEQGLYGSYAYANEMADKGANILGVLNFDMIAYLDTPDKDLKIFSHTNWQELAQIVIQSANTYTNIQAYNVPDNTMSRSDHWYFWQRNYPAVMGWENDKSHFYPYYHTTNDTIDKISTSFAAEVAKLGIASLAELANPVISTPPPPPVPEYKKINDTLVTSTNYKDTTVTNGTTYLYVVTAVDKAGHESAYSNEVSATPNDNTPPPAPPNITITQPTNGSILNTPQVNVSGTIDDNNSTVKVNGVSATVSNNTFTAKITLTEGQNTITVTATNSGGSTTKSITVTLDTTPPTITINSPTDGTKTKDSTITVSGSVSDNIGISNVTVNDKQATINGSNFTVSEIALQEGSNTISAKATDIAGNTKTLSITVIKDTTPPVITITSPEDGSIVSSRIVTVEGSVNELDATVTVNGSQVTLNNGYFSKTISLNNGLNTITVTATDPLKNTSTKTIKVTYAPGPNIQISPSTLPLVTLIAGQSTTQNFTISNVGDSDLVFGIGIAERNSQNSSLRGEDPLSLRAEGEAISYTNAEIPPTPGVSEHHPHRLLVKFKQGVAEQISASINALVGAQIIKTYNAIGIQKVEIPSNIELKEAIATYMDSGTVEYAELDFTVRALVTPNDPQFSSLWGLHNTGQNGGTNDADIDAPEAWDVVKGGSNVVIAVIDTGVDYNHEDLAGNMWTGPNGEHGYDFYNGDGDPMDDNGHGSHCAGTIAGVGNNGTGVVGVNWTARIMAVKFLSGDGYGYTSDAIDGIIYAVNNGARILSNSWGGGDYSQALKDAIEYANSHNVLFVAAAGNSSSNNDLDPHYPSSFDCSNIIAVAALDKNDNLASFSCYGLDSVDIGAPGVSILSTTPGNNYETYSGTSMATPHVSGVAGLVLAQNISLTDEEVKSKILNGAVQIPALTGKCLTGGRLNAYNSLEIEHDTTPPAPITNLAVSSVTFQSVTLTWTSTGDDGNSGIATSYDMRYSKNPITQDNFEDATQASGAPTPKPAGSTEICTISGLSEATQYYFAIKAIDESENKSNISNVPSAITVKSITIFSDNMENGSSKWSAESPWGLVTNQYNSPAHSWTDSPDGDYRDNVTTRLTSIPIDLSIYTSARLSFWHKYAMETNYDYAYILTSIDNGSNWSLLKTYNGHQNNWTNESIDLTPFCGIGKTEVRIRFLLVTDYSITYDGWYIDDIAITGSNNPLWLSINTTQGTIGVGQSKTITLSYNANVVPELYSAELEINNNSVNDTSISLIAQLNVNPPANAGKNAATVTASSEYSSAYRASNVIDGIIGAWDQGEWASQGSWDRNPWLKISWNEPQTVNTIIIYGRPNKYDKISNSRLTLSNGYSTAIGEIPIGGASKVIQIPISQITWLKIDVLETSAMNPGLTEIELYNVPRYQNKTNLALSANAVASSEYSSNYGATKAVDGIIGQWDAGEWAAQGSWDRNPSLKLSWDSPQTVNKIVIYGRPNKFDSIQNAKITLSNGYSITLGEIPSGGAGKEIYFPTAYITWLEFKVLETNALNPGLTEIEAYYEPVTTTNTNIARQSTASASSEYSSGYRASNAIDGIIGAWDQGEWASQGSWDRNPWLKLTWNTPQTVNKIIIYGRPNKYDSIQNAKITLSNGYSITLGEIPSGGAKKEISFPTATITWLEFKILETTALNAGLTEIEVYYIQNIEQTSLRAPIYRGEAISSNLTLLTNTDTDGDGIYDKYDAFDLDPTEWEDTDGDGMGNNMDWDDDDDGVLDEEDAYPLDIKRSIPKNTPPILIKEAGPWWEENKPGTKGPASNIDAIFLTIPQDTEKEKIKLFVTTAHAKDTMVLPIISGEPNIQSIIDTVIENDYDGVVIEETKTVFIANLSSALHNRGKQLIVSTEYTEDLDIYDIAQYMDRLILVVSTNDLYAIESAILDTRLQIPEEKIILDSPTLNTDIQDMLNPYTVLSL